MSISALETKFPFASVVEATGIPPKTLRNWMDRSKGPKLAADEKRQDARWRRHSALDGINLGLTFAVARLGVPIEKAAKIAMEAIPPSMVRPFQRDWDALAKSLEDRFAYIWRRYDNDQWDWTFRGDVDEVPKDIPGGAFIFIDVGGIAAAVLRELADIDSRQRTESSD